MMAQDGLVAIGGGVSNGPSPAAVFAKKAEVVYKFLPTKFLASLNIYHSNRYRGLLSLCPEVLRKFHIHFLYQ